MRFVQWHWSLSRLFGALWLVSQPTYRLKNGFS
uniref:Uncharacterized protein n=1 Tax=Anguilla anguilla TaxID=7936 RepID=A0A0E9Q5A6_ANGAN